MILITNIYLNILSRSASHFHMLLIQIYRPHFFHLIIEENVTQTELL